MLTPYQVLSVPMTRHGGSYDMIPLEVSVLRAPKLQDSRVIGNDVEQEPLLIAIESQDRLVSDNFAGEQ